MNREELAVVVSEILLKHLPETARPDAVESVVADLVRFLETSGLREAERTDSRFIVFTTLGANRSGIVFAFSSVLADLRIDIVDINQTIVHGNFAMMMILDPTGSEASFADLKSALKKRGQELGVQVYVQYEDMMRAVNRV